jgi:hypothetical protein
MYELSSRPISLSMSSIDDTNDTMYLIEQHEVGAGLKTARVVKLVHGPYDIDLLAAQLEKQLNDSSKTTVRGDYQIKKTMSGNFSMQNASSALYRYFTFYLIGGGSFMIADDAHLTSAAFYAQRTKRD